MKAILLAGGQGRRLRSITGKLPKPLVPLVGVPVLDRLLELLRRSGFTDVCATLCARAATFTARTIFSSSAATRRAALTCCGSTVSTKAPAPP